MSLARQDSSSPSLQGSGACSDACGQSAASDIYRLANGDVISHVQAVRTSSKSTAANSAGAIASDLGRSGRLDPAAYLQALLHSCISVIDELIGFEAAHGHLLHASD